MARKTTKTVTFSKRMEEYAKEALNEAQQINIEKKKYLLSIEADIIQAKAEGYIFRDIAAVATIELLKSDIQKSCIVKNKEGIEIEKETKITPADIKNICEPIEK